MQPNNTQQIAQRQALAPAQRQVTLQPQGRTVNTYEGAPLDSTLNGLVDGLKSFNPALENYVQTKSISDAQEAYREGTAQGNLADTLNPASGIQIPPVDEADRIQPAFNPSFATGYRRAVGAKIGGQIESDVLTKYQTEKNGEGFDPEAFLKEQVATHTTGLTDPDIISAVSKNVAGITKRVRSDFAQVQYENLKANATQTLSVLVGNAMDPTKTAAQQYRDVLDSVEPVRAQMGLQTRAELARMVFDQAHANSLKDGGQPEAFDVFTQFKDPQTGMSLVDMNPGLKPAVEQARLQAINAQTQRVQQGQQVDFFKTAVADESGAKEGRVPSLQEFVGRIGPMNQYKTADAALSDWNHLNKLADTAKVTASSVQAVGNGTAWGLTKEHAQKAMDVTQDADVKVLLQAASSATSGDFSQVPEVQQAIRSIVDITGRSGRSDIANSKLKGLIDGTVNALPPKDGQPSSQFKLASALYAGLPDQVRSLYFDEKAAGVFASYDRQREAGVSDLTAYQSAYEAMSPEGIKLAQEMASNPQWKARVANHVSGLTTARYQRIPIIGRAFGGSPQNEDSVSAWARLELQDYHARNPTASEDQAMSWVEARVKSSFVYEPLNKIDLQVPANQASEQTQAAIAMYLQDAISKYGADMSPGLIYARDGRYHLASFINGFPSHRLAEVTFDQMIRAHAAKTMLTDTDRQGMSALRERLITGNASVEDLIANSEALTKAESLGFLSDHMRSQIGELRSKQFKTLSESSFKFPVMPVDFVGLSGSRTTGEGSQAQVKQANYFLGNMNYSAALTAMGEGLVLKATPDPNPKAGLNIGYGYNLRANEGTIGEDFRRAGIPSTSLDGIKAGTTQITPEQAARLLEVALPRYAERAQKAVNAIQPNLWGNLNGNQRAALTDVAYQVGDVGQFQKALAALATGNQEAFAEQLKVTYANKDGNRVEDVRRNKLRSLMINSVSAFSQGVTEAGRTSH